MNSEIKWGPWNPEWENKRANYDNSKYEYALVPDNAPGFAGLQYVYEKADDSNWLLSHGGIAPTPRIFCKWKSPLAEPTDPHQPGVKLDAGKPRLSLVIKGFGDALTEVAKVATFGAVKYTDDGWREVPDGIARYTDAKFRHATQSGVDPESGLLHAAHEAWNALAVLQLMIEKERNNA